MDQTADVVICGAGIAGVCAAYWLAVRKGIRNVVLVDERAPMSLTSDKSTEAYRNWWPGPDDSMIRFMNRNIDLLEEWAAASDNRFLLNRRGYFYTTTNADRAAQFIQDARLAEEQGAGPIRTYRDVSEASGYRPSAHMGYENHPTGADIFLGSDAIGHHFPFLSPDLVAVLHARRCGWMSGQQLGAYLLDEAKAAGVTIVEGRVEGVDTLGDRVRSVRVAGTDGTNSALSTNVFVNAAGPFAKEVGEMVGASLPLFSELHLKVAFSDELRAVDRNTGLVILDDEQLLSWGDEEREALASDDETRWLTDTMPAGVHLRPEGYHESSQVLMLWDYHSSHRYSVPVFPLPEDAVYPEVVIRGLTRLVPALARYADQLPRSYVDGGYYTKTEENRPLIGPLATDGAYVTAAFSGFGLMAAPAAGELLAAYITGDELPAYARAFHPSRYNDPWYQELLSRWGSTGQL